MTAAVLFPDIEAALVTYLGPLLNVPVMAAVPTSMPAVRVHRAGGTRESINGESALVVVEAWAEDTVAACDLARLARAHVWAAEQQTIAGSVWVRGVSEIAGLASFTDPQTDLPRYTFTVQLHLGGTPL